jgi:hypothetical protein
MEGKSPPQVGSRTRGGTQWTPFGSTFGRVTSSHGTGVCGRLKEDLRRGSVSFYHFTVVI